MVGFQILIVLRHEAQNDLHIFQEPFDFSSPGPSKLSFGGKKRRFVLDKHVVNKNNNDVNKHGNKVVNKNNNNETSPSKYPFGINW